MSRNYKDSNFPIIEIFGSAFAFLLVLFIIFNIFSEQDLQQRLEKSLDEGTYKISWENNSEGYIVILFPQSMLISQTSEHINKNNICHNSNFRNYARQIYNTQKKQIIFAIVENATHTMKVARDCLQETFADKPISIGWIIANNELLKSIAIDDLPDYITNNQ